MDIHIHFLRRDFDEQGCQRVTPDHQQGVIGLEQGRSQRGILHPAPVDKESDLLAVGTRQRGRADKAGQFKAFFLRHYIQHLAGHVHAVERRQDGPPVAIPGGMQGGGIPLGKFEAHMRVRQGIACQQGVDRPALGGILLEELEARRDIVEQVFHADHRPDRRADLLQLADQAAFHAAGAPRQVNRPCAK